MNLDWFIARKNWEIDFLEKFNVKQIDYWYDEFMKKIDCLIAWRKTYYSIKNLGWNLPYNTKQIFILSTLH